ncbi:MAG TPA: YCF48-related protein [Pyrinomonadaceae bacterium]|nr:YCF48-related protein [Pyrinomonadaceae bacterium]
MLVVLCATVASAASAAWSRQRTGTMAWLHAVYFLDEQRGWAVGGSGALLATTDGGQSWVVMRRPTDDALRDLYFADERHGWLVCERSIYLLKEKDEPRAYLMNTTDGGATWRRVDVSGMDADARLVRALFTGGGRAWAFGEAGALFATRDGGQSWVRQRVPTHHLLLGGAFLNGTEGWIVGAGATLLQTSDGGETWRAGTIMGPSEVRFTAVSFVDRWRGWAVGGEGRVFATTDGGRNWRAQVSNVSADLYDVRFLDALEGWAVGAEGTVIHTKDGGRRWAREASGTTHPLERLFFVNRERGWAVGFGGTIIAYAPTAPKRPPELKRQK